MTAAISTAVMAAGLALFGVRAKICGVTPLHTELTTDLIQILNLLRCELLGSA